MLFSTADLCDRYAATEHVQILEPIFKVFGGKTKFCGRITTLKIFEDDALVATTLQEKVEDRVLVLDGGGSHRCAVLGGNLARLAYENGWQGIIVYGCIRNSQAINKMPIGMRALHTHPQKSHTKGVGDRDTLITFAGVNFKKDHFLYADEDGIIVSETVLS
ncbi:MAG: ribonuclease E activity regulator RraA [Gammaproteobacteria bacterium]